jgi:stage II sporulation protein AA (anti-sigma F factor antagonist)
MVPNLASVTELAPSSELVVRSHRDGEAFVVALYGELDLGSAPILERTLRMVEAVNSKHVVIDLSALEFIDSIGLHLLIRAHERWFGNGRRLSLLRGPHAVHRVFELTNTVALFAFED